MTAMEPYVPPERRYVEGGYIPARPVPPRLDPIQVFHTVVAQHTARGYRVESMTGLSAVMVSGTPCNHVLHAILSFFLCGLWLPIWAILAATQRVLRVAFTVTGDGRVLYGQGESVR